MTFYFWTAAKEGDVQDIIKMQRELEVTLSKFIKKFVQESIIKHVWRNGLNWEKKFKWEEEGNKGMVKPCFDNLFFFFGEIMAKALQISE